MTDCLLSVSALILRIVTLLHLDSNVIITCSASNLTSVVSFKPGISLCSHLGFQSFKRIIRLFFPKLPISQLIFLRILDSENPKKSYTSWESLGRNSCMEILCKTNHVFHVNKWNHRRQFPELASKPEPLISLSLSLMPSLLNATSHISWAIIISPVTRLPLPLLLALRQQSLRWPSCSHFWPNKINSTHNSQQKNFEHIIYILLLPCLKPPSLSYYT